MSQVCALVDDKYSLFIDRPSTDSRGWLVSSVAKVCPLCLSRWAVLFITGQRYHRIHEQLCKHCGEQAWNSVVPGSLLEDCSSQTTDWDLLNYLPLNLLLREFNLHLRFLANLEPIDESANLDLSAANSRLSERALPP